MLCTFWTNGVAPDPNPLHCAIHSQPVKKFLHKLVVLFTITSAKFEEHLDACGCNSVFEE